MEHNETPSDHLAALGGHDGLLARGIEHRWAYHMWDAARLHARDGADRWRRDYWMTYEMIREWLRDIVEDDD